MTTSEDTSPQGEFWPRVMSPEEKNAQIEQALMQGVLTGQYPYPSMQVAMRAQEGLSSDMDSQDSS